MTTAFVPSLVGDALLHLPQTVADTLPPMEHRWPDEFLLALPADAIARADDVTVAEALNASRRQRSRLAAQETRLLARLDALRGGDRYVADEAGLELRISRHAAQARVGRAVTLIGKLPGVVAAMDDGGSTATRPGGSPTSPATCPTRTPAPWMSGSPPATRRANSASMIRPPCGGKCNASCTA